MSLCNTGPVAVSEQIVCMHDVNSRLVPESYGLMFRTAYRVLQPALGRRAAARCDGLSFLAGDDGAVGYQAADEITVIHDGYEHVLEWKADRSTVDVRNLSRPFVLLLGSKAPHKNVAIIYSIAAELAGKGIHVLVAGGEDANVYARWERPAAAERQAPR